MKLKEVSPEYRRPPSPVNFDITYASTFSVRFFKPMLFAEKPESRCPLEKKWNLAKTVTSSTLPPK
jgi:hypothetical protein